MIRNNWKQNDVRDISIIEIMTGLLKRWKLLLCCAVAGALMFMSYGYYKNRSNTVTDAQLHPGETLLTEAEQKEVEYAKALKNIIDEQNAYMEETLLLKINAYQEDRVILQYKINGIDADDAFQFLEQCTSYIENGRAVEDILLQTGESFDLSAQFLQELIGVGRSESVYDVFNDSLSRYFCVYVIGKDKDMAERLAEALENVFDSYGEQEHGQSGRGLVLLSRQNGVVYDMNLEQKKNTLLSSQNAQINTLNSITAQFTENQRAAYSLIPDDKTTEEKEMKSNLFRYVKYIILGIVVGIFLGCCWIIGWYLLSDKIKSVGEIERNYDLCVYGALKKRTRDEAADLRLKNQILARMVLNCHKNNLEQLIFISEQKISPFFGKNSLFEKELKEQGIKSIVVESMSESVQMYGQLENTDAVVIFAEVKKTTYSEFDKMLRILHENNILLAGVIVME